MLNGWLVKDYILINAYVIRHQKEVLDKSFRMQFCKYLRYRGKIYNN